MLDIAATVDNRKTRIEWVRNVASVISMPFDRRRRNCRVGDIEQLLEAGADKVSINSAGVKQPG